MEVSAETTYQPPAGFVEDRKDPLINLSLTDSTELWLIQWPINEAPDFDGQQVSLNLKGDGNIGTFEGSSGKSYEVVSLKSQGPVPTVFLSTTSEAKIAGKISRHVSLNHYPEPAELQRRKTHGNSQRSSMATSTISGHRLLTPSQSSRPRGAVSGYSTPSTRTKSGISESVEPSKRKHKRNDESRSANRSAQDSEKGDSGITTSGSVERKAKKAKKSTS